jgi:hypothetical protein
MNLRSVVRLAIVLALVGVSVFSAKVAAAQTDAPREQTRLGKMSVLKAGLKAIESVQDQSGGFPPGLDNPVDPRATAEAVSMLIALRNEGVDVEADAALAYLQQTDPVAWVESQGVTLTDGEVARIVIGLVAAGGVGASPNIDYLDYLIDGSGNTFPRTGAATIVGHGVPCPYDDFFAADVEFSGEEIDDAGCPGLPNFVTF